MPLDTHRFKVYWLYQKTYSNILLFLTAGHLSNALRLVAVPVQNRHSAHTSSMVRTKTAFAWDTIRLHSSTAGAE